MPLGEVFTREGTTLYPCTDCEAEYTYEYDARECCLPQCSNCGAEHITQEHAENCCSYSCHICDEYHSSQEDAEDCCAHIWRCDSCGATWEDVETAQECCGTDRAYDNAGNLASDSRNSTEFPAHILDLAPEYHIYIPRMAGRPTRSCSIEQELSSGGRAVARLMAELGYSDHDQVVNYSRDARPQRIVVKEDGTLPRNGAEVVYSRFLLSETSGGGETLSRAIACIRELKKEGIVTTTQAAGLHIHIGATTINGEKVFGPGQMAALYEIFSFSESVLFKLASAGWRGHRGDSYSTRLTKFSKDQISPARVAMGSHRHRYFALNFQRLLTAAQQCACGACVSGDWEECECGVMQNGTIEWRVFNATTKPETLHAWLLLAHAMTAAAFNHQLGTLDPNAFEETDPSPDRDPWILGWILNNCPFSNSEKQVVIDLAKRAPGLEIDWPDFERHVVNWGGQGQTELLDVPLEIEDDAERSTEVSPMSDLTTEAEQVLQTFRIQTSTLTGMSNQWTTAAPFITHDPVEELAEDPF